jgi:ketosteroid isomerase-like protein
MTMTQALLDERDIVAVCVRYATALDTKDWALLRTCFTPDAVTDYGEHGGCNGYEEIETLVRAAIGRMARTQHLLGNFAVTVDGDEARAECYLQAQHVRPEVEGGPNFIIAGRYLDKLVRTTEGWRIAHRTLETWWTEGNAAVVA